MRAITRSYEAVHVPNKLKEPITLSKLEDIASTANTSLIEALIYRDPYYAGRGKGQQSKIIDKLNEWYHHKCAYCERYYKLDVEHFRPKGEIRDENNRLTSATGYYWLCYEWSNLLPSCISCNREGGKGSKFPYVPGGLRKTSPVYSVSNKKLDYEYCNVQHRWLLEETPALLNPETETNFLKYFSFRVDDDFKGITIYGIDTENRGEITINTCNLNREEIRRDRVQAVVKGFTNSIKRLIKQLEREEIDNARFKRRVYDCLESLFDDCEDDELSHTLLRKFIVNSPSNFNEVVLPFISPKFKIIIKTAYSSYLTENR